MSLAETLERFNRKERHWLIRDVLGKGATRLDDDFGRRVQEAVRQRDPIFCLDPNAWWAIDYHIDWLVAAFKFRENVNVQPNWPKPNAGFIEGHQRDIDLLIASGNTLILVEAKGVGSWDSKFVAKIDRLKQISNLLLSEAGAVTNVTLHFVLCSPAGTLPVVFSDWPKWMLTPGGQPLIVQLQAKRPRDGFLRVERCDEKGGPAEGKGYWHVVDDTTANNLLK